jgi:3-phosphoshikimate 1-carboxyvinyltransferase
MSFAVAGLRTPGVRIKNPDCVAKSFPNFWQVFQRLYG